jgi:predicted PurR-regulated permease PerM
MASDSGQGGRAAHAPTPAASEVRAPARPPGLATLRPEHLYKAVLLLFLLALFFRFFREIAQTLLLVYAAAIVAVALNPIARRFPTHRKWVAGLIGLAVLSAVGTALWFGIPALIGQLREMTERAPEFQARFEEWAEWLRQATGLNIALLGEQTAGAIQGTIRTLATEELFGRARGVLEVLLVPFIVLIGGMYALADPNNRLLLPVMRLVPRTRRNAFYRIFQLLGERLFNWIRGTLIAMFVVGALSTTALYLIGVPYWLLLGTFIGLVEFIVIFGPWIGGIPAVIIAFLDEPMKGLWAALAIIAIQQLESYLITPWAMSQAAKIHPLITLFALIVFGSIFGILGVLLALPIVILIWTVVQVLWVERALGTDADRIPLVVEE